MLQGELQLNSAVIQQEHQAKLTAGYS